MTRGGKKEKDIIHEMLLPDFRVGVVRSVEQMGSLGVMLGRKGGSTSNVDHMFVKTQGVYGANAKSFKNKNGTWGEKIRAWARGPAMSADFAAAGWHLTEPMLLRAKRRENKHLRRILGLRSGKREGNQDFNIRSANTINDQFVHHKVARLHHKILRDYHRLATLLCEFKLEDGTMPLK